MGSMNGRWEIVDLFFSVCLELKNKCNILFKRKHSLLVISYRVYSYKEMFIINPLFRFLFVVSWSAKAFIISSIFYKTPCLKQEFTDIVHMQVFTGRCFYFDQCCLWCFLSLVNNFTQNMYRKDTPLQNPYS